MFVVYVIIPCVVVGIIKVSDEHTASIIRAEDLVFLQTHLLTQYIGAFIFRFGVLWLRQLVADLSLRRPGSVRVGFVVDKVALGQVCSAFPRQYHGSPCSYITSGLTTGLLVAAVQRHSLTKLT
jgi:hypothetical protein